MKLNSKYLSSLVLYGILYFIFFVVLYTFVPEAKAQQNPDSLKHLLSSAPNDSLRKHYLIQLGQIAISTDSIAAHNYFRKAIDLKRDLGKREKEIEVLWEMGRAYCFAGNYEHSLLCFHTATQKSLKIADTAKIINSLYSTGVIAWQKGDYKGAIDHFNASLEYSKPAGNKELMSAAYNGIGVIYLVQLENEEAMKALIEANRLSKEIGDYLEIGNTACNIALIYGRLKNYDASNNYLKQAIKYWSKIDNQRHTAAALHNISGNYFDLGQMDSAYYYAKKALEIRRFLDDKRGISHTLALIGDIRKEEGEYQKSVNLYRQAIQIQDEIGDIMALGKNYLYLGSAYTELKMYDSVTVCLNKGMEIALEQKDKDLRMKAYKYFAEFYAMKKNYDLAYDYQKLYQQLKDSIYTEESNRNLLDMHIRYETELKNAMLRELSEKIKKYEYKLYQNRRTIFTVTGSISFFLILLFIVLSAYYISRYAIPVNKENNTLSLSTLLREKTYPFLRVKIVHLVFITLYFFLILVLLKPYKLGVFEKNNILYLIEHTGIFLVLFILINQILTQKISRIFDPSKWTLTKESLFIVCNVLLIGSLLLIFSALITRSKIDFIYVYTNLLFGFTIALLPVLIRIYKGYIYIVNMEYRNTISLINKKVRYFRDKSDLSTEKLVSFFTGKASKEIVFRKDDILFIRSDNIYIEIYYKIEDSVKKELIRNKLKYTEDILAEYPEFCRCHRSFIVNLKNVKDIKTSNQKYYLTFLEIDEKIPISRSYTKEIVQFLTINN